MNPKTNSKRTFKAVLIDPTEKKYEVIDAPKDKLKELLHADKLKHTEIIVGARLHTDGKNGRFLALSGDAECNLPCVLNYEYEPLIYGRVLICLDDGGGCWEDLDLKDIGTIYSNMERLCADRHHSREGYPMLTHTEKCEIL